MDEVQRDILRILYDPKTHQSGASRLRHGLEGPADALVERGLLWKREGRHPRPTYGLTPEGIATAQAAWQDAT